MGITLAGYAQLRAESETVYLGKVFLGIGGDHVALPEDSRYRSKFGIKVVRVPVGSSAEKAGLEIGDIVVSIDGTSWENDQIRLSRSFGKAGDKAIVGVPVHLVVLKTNRQDPSAPRELRTIQVPLASYPRARREEPRMPTNDEIRPDLAGHTTAYEDLCWRLIRKFDYEHPSRDLLARLDRSQSFPDPERLPIVRYVHRDPFKLEVVSSELVDPLAARTGPKAADCRFFIEHGRGALLGFGSRGEAPAISEPEPTYQDQDLTAHLDYVEVVLQAAAKENVRAFAALSDEDRKTIREHRSDLLDVFIESHMLSYDNNQGRQRGYLPILDLARKVNFEAMVAQARLLALLVHPDFTLSLRTAAEEAKADLESATVVQRDTKFGPVIVAGRGRNRHSNAPAAVIYDLGGNDIYAHNQGGSVMGQIPSSIIVDYEGDDAYETHQPFTQACGDLGVGMIVDLKGDDSYVGTRFTQGAAFLGVGVLIDEAGDDIYRGQEFHQGVGHWGIGLLIDGAGDDRYEADMTSQGVGLPMGFGLVADFGSGEDQYYCKGRKPSGYGTAGVFAGWGQGLGVGYRPYASGGVGVIFDAGGRDRIEGGNFTQGGGYFYGLGLVYNDGQESDQYIGSRWAQGWSAHQAAGVMIDAGGDDHYTTRFNVVQGCAWDEAVSLFIDEAGNDVYEGGGFSQGASANNGWSIFLERGGRDIYRDTDQAKNGGNVYHGGSSLSFFVDIGGDEDIYPSRPNNQIQAGGKYSIFIDLPAAIEAARSEQALEDLLKP
jgi:hypothetical protein